MLPGSFRKNPPVFLQAIARDYGDIVHYRLGPQDVYLVSNPDWIKDILVTNQANFTKSRFLERAKVLLGDGLLTSEGEFPIAASAAWSNRPFFIAIVLIGYASAMVETTERDPANSGPTAPNWTWFS